MRYSMGFAGALLLAMSSSVFAADAIRDAGTKVRGEWLGAAQPAAVANQGVIYRSYSVAPSTSAPVAVAPAPAVAAQPNTAVRSYSYAPTQGGTYSYGNRSPVRSAPYLRADHKIMGQYGD